MEKATCTVDGCVRIQRSRGWCDMHYQRVRHHGSVDLPPRPEPEALFWSQVDKVGPIKSDELGPCWLWLAYVMPTGYSFWQIGRRKTTAHRFAYELVYGPIPDGLHIDHLCKTRSCVRPSHLEAVTQAENNRRAAKVRGRKTHCPRGHEYAGENLYVTANKQHACRACKRITAAAVALRKAAVA
jgi:hypothetical protein